MHAHHGSHAMLVTALTEEPECTVVPEAAAGTLSTSSDDSLHVELIGTSE